MPEEQKPFLILRLCQTCGFWKITTALLDAFAQVAGTQHMCPDGHGELRVIEAEEGLMILSKVIDAAEEEDTDDR